MIKVIIIQPRPVSRLESPENRDLALRLLEHCRGQRADLICFPEYFPFSGEAELSQAARELRAYIIGGLVEDASGGRYNTATLFDREGRVAGRQRKVTLGALEVRGFGVHPGRDWQALDTDFGRLGVAVCIDFWGQPEAVRQLSAQGVDLIINPSIFPILRSHWKTGAMVRSFDYYLPVIGVNTAAFVAEIAGRQYVMQGGGSFALQPPAPPDEKELAALIRTWDDLSAWTVLEADEGEGIFSVTLDLTGVRRCRPWIFQRFGII